MLAGHPVDMHRAPIASASSMALDSDREPDVRSRGTAGARHALLMRMGIERIDHCRNILRLNGRVGESNMALINGNNADICR